MFRLGACSGTWIAGPTLDAAVVRTLLFRNAVKSIFGISALSPAHGQRRRKKKKIGVVAGAPCAFNEGGDVV